MRAKSITGDHLDVSIRNPDATTEEPVIHQQPALESSTSRFLTAAAEVPEPPMIEDALREIAGNKQKAAQVLDLSLQR